MVWHKIRKSRTKTIHWSAILINFPYLSGLVWISRLEPLNIRSVTVLRSQCYGLIQWCTSKTVGENEIRCGWILQSHGNYSCRSRTVSLRKNGNSPPIVCHHIWQLSFSSPSLKNRGQLHTSEFVVSGYYSGGITFFGLSHHADIYMTIQLGMFKQCSPLRP